MRHIPVRVGDVDVDDPFWSPRQETMSPRQLTQRLAAGAARLREGASVIGLFVRFDIRDEPAARRFDELTAVAVGQIEAKEPGTLVYATHRVEGAPLSRVFYEVYADEAAFQIHEEAPHVKEFHRSKDPLLDREPRVEFFRPGPAKGLPV